LGVVGVGGGVGVGVGVAVAVGVGVAVECPMTDEERNDPFPGVYTRSNGLCGLGRADLPDLTDPATLGCLLALVREAWGPDLRVFRDGVWFVEYVPPHFPENMYGQRTFTGATEAEALVDALVDAP
jgi:hypothetical protein